MSLDDRIKDLMAAFQKTAYFQWMARQRIPIIDGYGIEDVREVEMADWPRLGGRAAFINLYGMEGVTAGEVDSRLRGNDHGKRVARAWASGPARTRRTRKPASPEP